MVGGGLGGIAAALSALALGARVVLTEEFDWLGGQLTTQGVPLDEGPWIESGVGSRSYAGLRERIRDHYRRNYPLTAAARRSWPLNPGMGNVGTLCVEPAVAVRVDRRDARPLGKRGAADRPAPTPPRRRPELGRPRHGGRAARPRHRARG